MLLLFFVYAGCALMLCVLGAQSFRQTAQVLEENYNQRTGAQYVAQKIRQNDIAGSVRIEQFKGTDALVLVEQESGQGFETWIFVMDGHLCEQLIAAESEIVNDQAQTIMPMQKLELSFDDTMLLKVALTTTEGTVDTIKLALRAEGNTFNSGDAPPVSPAVETQSSALSGPTIMATAPAAKGDAE